MSARPAQGPRSQGDREVTMEIDPKTWLALEAHALECYPDECCGVLLSGPAGLEVARIRNIQDEMHERDPQRYPRTARTAYAGDPRDLQAVLERAESPGYRLAAFYHSHPDHDAYFSEEDVAQATPFGDPSYPDAVQLVVSVRNGKVAEVKGFAWSAERSTYAETPVRIC
jgi:proteasome lid subunit RPN8/RPN11